MAHRDDDDDDDDEFHRQQTLVEKSDRMAREISARREIRLREERVRLLTDQPGAKRGKRPRTGGHPRPQLPVDHTETVPIPPPSGARQVPRDTDPDREPRLSDPFPPIDRERAESRPQRAPAPAPSRPAPAPAPPPQAPRGPSQMDILAVELEELIRSLRAGWRRSRGADKAALIASLMTLAGVFAPWLSDPAHRLQLGINAGGVFHAALALGATILVVRTTPAYGVARGGRNELARRYRRAGLWLVLLGASSTLLCVFFLVNWSIAKGPDWPIDIHPGFYWTLAWGTGVSYGGYARFSGGPEERR